MISPSLVIGLRKSGVSVIPVNNKIPIVKGWRTLPVSLSEFSGDGIALVCGMASHNVEVIDIDNHSDKTEEILNGLLRVCPRVVVNRTQHGGYHLIYRCSKVEGNRKLAKENGLTVVETRGEGGIIVIPPTCGYETLVGSLFDIPVITTRERERLFKEAVRYDEQPERKTVSNTTPAAGGQPRGKGSIRERFNSIEGAGDAALQVMLSHGWVMVGNNRIRRPGKKWGHSGTWGYLSYPYVLYVFSSNCSPFEPNRAYTPFDIYMKLEYNEDISRAIDAIKNRRL